MIPLHSEEGIAWSSSNTSCSSTSWIEYGTGIIDEDETKVETELMKYGLEDREKLTIFVHNKTKRQTFSFKVSQQLKIKTILDCMIKTEPQNYRYRYFLIHKESKKILNPAKSFSDYQIQNKSILILTRQPLNTSAKGYTKSKNLIIICNFGAPYNKKLLSSYHGDVSLNEYAFKIKDKFCMPQTTKITFNFRGIPRLGIERMCSIKQLGIAANEKIIAQTNGINLTLKSFGSTNKMKLIEMYKHFDLNQLKQQIVLELGIPIDRQKALICKGWRIIDSDHKCKQIKEYETITVLTSCQCHLKKPQKMQHIQTNCANPSHSHNPELSKREDGDHYLYYLHRSHYTLPRSNHKLYRKKVSVPRQHEYDHSYNNNNRNMALGDKYCADEDDDESHGSSEYDDYNAGATHTGAAGYYMNSDTLKLCRWGDQCRYFNNPHIFGGCRFYHPPPISQQNCSWKSYYTLHHGTTKKNKYKTNYTMIY